MSANWRSMCRTPVTRIGFTGTRRGMSRAQLAGVHSLLFTPGGSMAMRQDPGLVLELHHGDCVGADGQLHRMAFKLGHALVLHPATDPRMRANSVGAIHEHQAKPALMRNRDIVDATQVLWAAPAGPEADNPRSGTWATIRYAKKQGRRVLMWMPCGTLLVHPE